MLCEVQHFLFQIIISIKIEIFLIKYIQKGIPKIFEVRKLFLFKIL